MDYIYIGRVASTHGVKGAIKVFPTTDDPKRFNLLKEIVLEDSKGGNKKYTIQKIKYVNKFVVVELEEVTDMNAALLLKQCYVKIPKADALPLDEDEYYVQDLRGLKVVLEDESEFGILKDVLFTGSNDVYVVTMTNGKELLLPAIKECVLSINMETRIVKVHIMEGLM